jgi:hypothetical protein
LTRGKQPFTLRGYVDFHLEFGIGGCIMSLAEALKRLGDAVSALERASVRRLELDRRGGDLPTELALMQDDRARLAVELDGTLARVARLERVAGDVDERLAAALEKVETVLSGERGG